MSTKTTLRWIEGKFAKVAVAETVVATVSQYDRQGNELSESNVTRGFYDPETGSIFVPFSFEDGREGAIEYLKQGGHHNAADRYAKFKPRLLPVVRSGETYVCEPELAKTAIRWDGTKFVKVSVADTQSQPDQTNQDRNFDYTAWETGIMDYATDEQIQRDKEIPKRIDTYRPGHITWGKDVDRGLSIQRGRERRKQSKNWEFFKENVLPAISSWINPMAWEDIARHAPTQEEKGEIYSRGGWVKHSIKSRGEAVAQTSWSHPQATPKKHEIFTLIDELKPVPAIAGLNQKFLPEGYVLEGNQYVYQGAVKPVQEAVNATTKARDGITKTSDASATKDIKGRFQEHIAGRNWTFEWTAYFGSQPGSADGVSVSKPAAMPDYIWEQNQEALQSQAESQARQQWRRLSKVAAPFAFNVNGSFGLEVEGTVYQFRYSGKIDPLGPDFIELNGKPDEMPEDVWGRNRKDVEEKAQEAAYAEFRKTQTKG
jgi:hypothetical protein